MLVNEVHERRLMEQREHAVEVCEVVLQERKSLVLGWQRLEYTAGEYIAEDVGLPMYPFVVVNCSIGDHVLERRIASFVVDPLNTLGRENGETRRGP